MSPVKPREEIPEERDLTPPERELVRWLLLHSGAEGERFLDQVDRIRVISRCPCGCASINFDLEGRGWNSGVLIQQTLGDCAWMDDEGRWFEVFVFVKDDTLAGLEVYSMDGRVTPTTLPDIPTLDRFM